MRQLWQKLKEKPKQLWRRLKEKLKEIRLRLIEKIPVKDERKREVLFDFIALLTIFVLYFSPLPGLMFRINQTVGIVYIVFLFILAYPSIKYMLWLLKRYSMQTPESSKAKAGSEV